MKKLKLKNMVLAAALAVGLGLTGIAATAQAAEEVAPMAECDHNWVYQFTLVSYDTRDVSNLCHTKYLMHIYRCSVCGSMDEIEEEVWEPHDLVYNYSNDRYECAHCDYWE